jgi:hypothetical protein
MTTRLSAWLSRLFLLLALGSTLLLIWDLLPSAPPRRALAVRPEEIRLDDLRVGEERLAVLTIHNDSAQELRVLGVGFC